MFSENLLHFIWQYHISNHMVLQTTTGESITLIKKGQHNLYDGPDFSEARIQIGDIEWAGHVEIHVYETDWKKHRHSGDPRYKNVILHVVYKADATLQNRPSDLQQMPTLELAPLIPSSLLERYQELMQSKQWIACKELLPSIDSNKIYYGLNRLAVERMEQKMKVLKQWYGEASNNWALTFWIALAKALGAPANQETFVSWAKTIPLQLIQKLSDDTEAVEAILFGQANLIPNDSNEEYSNLLREKYTYYQKLHHLKPIPPNSWNFSKVRPSHFPTIRIAQLSALLIQQPHLLSHLLTFQHIKEYEQLWNTVTCHPYWDTHYVFGTPTIKRKKQIGQQIQQSILINTWVPFLFLYAKETGKEEMMQKALELLEALPAEQNNILRGWMELDICANSALESQALLQLKKEYCKPKKCLQCHIGQQLLKV